MRHSHKSKDETRASYIHSKPGSKALLWLFKSGNHDRLDLFTNPRFTLALGFCMVTERAESHLMDWILMDRKPVYTDSQESKSLASPMDVIHQGQVARGVVEAQAY